MPECVRCAAALVAVLAVLLLAACSDAPEWRTQSLEADFPDLAFELTTDRSDAFTEADLRGNLTLLFFGYTSCPDACPTTMTRLRAVLDELPDAQREHVRVLFVSVDPDRDTPGRLAAYADHYGPEFIGATAELVRLTELVQRYGSSFRHEPGRRDGDYVVTHGSHVLAFDGDGRARLLIQSSDSVEAIAHDLRHLLAS